MMWVTLTQAVAMICQGWTFSSSQAAQETWIYLNPGFFYAVRQQDPVTFQGGRWLFVAPFGAQMGEAWPHGLGSGWMQEVKG